MFKKLLILFGWLFFQQPLLRAQYNDAQIWENINLEKVVSPKFTVRINQEGRFTDNDSRFSFVYLDMGVNYKINKHFHATLAYVWVEKRAWDDTWSTRHQAYADITVRQKLKGFLVTDRQMFLWQVKDYFSSATGRIPDYYLRNKITIKYEKNFRWQPYVASELYYRLQVPEAGFTDHFNRQRFFAGVFYHPNLINELELYYMVERHFHEVNPATNWIIGLGYTHTF